MVATDQPADATTSRADIAKRLILLREAFGLSQRQLCAMTGIGVTSWNNYERAVKRIPVDKVAILRARLGVTGDWIYWGDVSGLPATILSRLVPPTTLANGSKAPSKRKSVIKRSM